MHQSEGTAPLQVLFVDRFVQWSSHPMMILIQTPSFAVVPNIGELKALTYLNLNSTEITGTLDFYHHPVMAADFCSSAAVPNIGELKALTYLDLENTGITGTADFDHHPAMAADFCCASQRSRLPCRN
jgi:hypothetical protein